MSDRRMYEIQLYDGISARHASYQRELERLACEVEDHLEVLDEGKPDGVRYVAARLREALDRIYNAGVLRAAKATENR